MKDKRHRTISAVAVETLLVQVPAMGETLVVDVVQAVPEYRTFFGSARGDVVRRQIEIALKTFVRLVGDDGPGLMSEEDARVRPAIEAARAMGRSEARAGRGNAVVLNAFRVGARSAWGSIADQADTFRWSGAEVALLAGLLFDFIDRISAATVSGHQEEVEGLQRTRDLERDALVRAVITRGIPLPDRVALAQWELPPQVVVVLGSAQAVRVAASRAPDGTIMASGDLPGGPRAESAAVLLVPVPHPGVRTALLAALQDVSVVVAPATTVNQARHAYRWALVLWTGTGGPVAGPVVDVNRRVPAVLVGTEPQLVALLRERHLAPLSTLSAAKRAVLEQTLGSWIRHRGRQDQVAAELFVHPKTVRYRLRRLEELLGAAIYDPDLTMELLVCVCEDNPQI